MVNINRKYFNMEMSGLIIEVTPKYIQNMSKLSQAGKDLLLVSQFILAQGENKVLVDLSYPLVQKICKICEIVISKDKYRKGIRELEKLQILTNIENNSYKLCDIFSYVSIGNLEPVTEK